MPWATMPPPGGRLTCPPGTQPWVVKDRHSGEINAECRLSPTLSSNADRTQFVLNNVESDDRSYLEQNTGVLESGVRAGFIQTTKREYYFEVPEQESGLQEG